MHNGNFKGGNGTPDNPFSNKKASQGGQKHTNLPPGRINRRTPGNTPQQTAPGQPVPPQQKYVQKMPASSPKQQILNQEQPQPTPKQQQVYKQKPNQQSLFGPQQGQVYQQQAPRQQPEAPKQLYNPKKNTAPQSPKQKMPQQTMLHINLPEDKVQGSQQKPTGAAENQPGEQPLWGIPPEELEQQIASDEPVEHQEKAARQRRPFRKKNKKEKRKKQTEEASPSSQADEADVWNIVHSSEEQQAQQLEEEREREKANRKRRRRRRWIKRGIISLVTTFVLMVAALFVFLEASTRNDDLWLELEQIPYRGETILLYTNQETGEVGEYARLPSTQNKEYVDGTLMPQHLKHAFVAIEDRNFYNHSGVDLKRTAYAVLNEMKRAVTGSYIGGESGYKQGASTIDQQLIKNLTRDDEDSDMAGYLRKMREIYRAYKLDAAYDKELILEAYLNTISFTGNTAGVQAESRKLFGKTVDELSLAECASLAAITRNPSRYNPVTNPDVHTERRNYVLQLMLEQEYISQQEHDEAVATPLWVTGDRDPVREQTVTSYFTDAVINEVLNELKTQRNLTHKEAVNLLYNGGLRIYTTVVPELQKDMENTMDSSSRVYPKPTTTAPKQQYDEQGNAILDENGNPVYEQERVTPQAAMVSLNYDGGICAVVGGLGDKEISLGFNRSTQALRQVGSTMKTISPYVTALEDGKITWSSPFLDGPVRKEKDEATGEEKDWPTNVDNRYSNKDILVREAFARSVNTVAVRVGETVGDSTMFNFVRNDLGIESFTKQDNDAGPLVLGSSTYGISPLDMARSYAMFGNGGYVPTAHSFTTIENGNGTMLLVKDIPKKQAIGDDTAFIMNRLMGEVMRGSGTASGMSVPGQMESIGKTGTTSDNRDHWFIGLTPYYVTASWYGYDENVPLSVSSRQHPPTVAWRNVMQQAQQGLPYKEFPGSGNVEQHEYCTVSGAAAGPRCPSATGWYSKDNPPKGGCPVHG